jgi:hypothetical protein
MNCMRTWQELQNIDVRMRRVVAGKDSQVSDLQQQVAALQRKLADTEDILSAQHLDLCAGTVEG